MRRWKVTTPIIGFEWDSTVDLAENIEILDNYARSVDGQIPLDIPYRSVVTYDRLDPAVVFRAAIQYCREVLDMEPEIESESIQAAGWNGKIQTGDFY